MRMKALTAGVGSKVVFPDGTTANVDIYGFVSVPSAHIPAMIAAGFEPAVIPNNFTATTDPAVTNDTTEGYEVGSKWLNTTTGRLYVARTVTDGAAAWDAVNAAGDLAMVAGRFYGANGEVLAAVLTVLDVIYAHPIYVSSKITVDSLSVNVTTGQTGGVGRIGIYKDNNGVPGARVYGSAEVTMSATAVATASAVATVLEPGWYWLATTFSATSTQPSVAGIAVAASANVNGLLGNATAAHALAVATTNNSTGVQKTAQAYAALPATFPSAPALVVAATTPAVAIGIAA